MKPGVKVGVMGTLRFVVEPRHTIDFAVDGMPEILSTPWLIWFLEHAAREALLPYLDPGESTVGTHVDVDHLAATPVGMEVVCLARVVHLNGLTVTFQLEARDQVERIAKGLCRARVVKVDRLARRVEAKRGR
ncbi:MAG: thioesterase [Isosphaeraceae bacterium]|jgi:predicted thioesterase|nr:MAG: thioesterase [Isosphaeraceae bacterium]